MDDFRPIFIGGHNRSGTSVMRVMLNRHPGIACGPEGSLLKRTSIRSFHEYLEATWLPDLHTGYGFEAVDLDRAMAAFVDDFFTRYRVHNGKRRWAEKTPRNILDVDYLFRLFPRAQFIHLVRDPRDVYCSVLEKLRDDPRIDRQSADRMARRWLDCIESGRKWRGVQDKYIEIRYEQMVMNPVAIMKSVLYFLGEPWDQSVLEPTHEARHTDTPANRHAPMFSTSVGRWRRDLVPTDLRHIEAIAGETMRETGYETT
ncbi:MAG: hypothetical protein NVSMB52_11610 [Chloroflexota bacterium]